MVVVVVVLRAVAAVGHLATHAGLDHRRGDVLLPDDVTQAQA